MLSANGIKNEVAARYGSTPSVPEWDALARRISVEVGAPVGMIDPAHLAWLARVGTTTFDRFPAADTSLIATLTTLGVGQGRAAVWAPTPGHSPLWLVFA